MRPVLLEMTGFASFREKTEVSFADTDYFALVGPTGAGKSHLARRIYELTRVKRQVKGPLVEVNCATLKGDSAMSALFGHKKSNDK